MAKEGSREREREREERGESKCVGIHVITNKIYNQS